MVGNKIADKITKVSRKVSSQNSPGIVTNETENNGIDREIPNERYISSEKKYQKIINLLENTPNQPSKYRTKIGLKQVQLLWTPIIYKWKLQSKIYLFFSYVINRTCYCPMLIT